MRDINALFLDSDRKHWAAIRSKLPGVKWVKDSLSCTEAIAEEDTWNILIINCDEGELVFSWIVDNEPIIRNIVCFSEDLDTARDMADRFREEKYMAGAIQFSILVDNLEKV